MRRTVNSTKGRECNKPFLKPSYFQTVNIGTIPRFITGKKLKELKMKYS